jgi:phosphoribosylformimino-5-aminoimidazole carboxamide ribotide isomerase
VREWLARFGAERIIIGADFKDGYIAVSAWTEQSDQTLPGFIGTYLAAGATTFICTDVSRDGQLQGPATATYTAMRQQFPAAHFVASGGVTTVADVAAMREIGMGGAIIGKAIYEGTITEAELRTELAR